MERTWVKALFELLVGGGLLAVAIPAIVAQDFPTWLKLVTIVLLLATSLSVGIHSIRRDRDKSSEVTRTRIREATRSRSAAQLSQLAPSALQGPLNVRIQQRSDIVRDSALRVPSVRTATSWNDVFEGSHERMLLIGGPGAGKTFIAYQLIGQLTERSRDVILIDATEWPTRSTDDIVEKLATQVSKRHGVTAEQFRSWAYSYSPVLVVDGLDEIDPERAEQVMGDLKEWARDVKRGLLVVCRSREWMDRFQVGDFTGGFEVKPLSRSEVRRVVEVLALGDPDWGHLATNSEAYRLLLTPLFASLILEGAISASDVDNKPTNEARQVLFSRYVDSLTAGLPSQWRGNLRWIAAFMEHTTPSIWGHRNIGRNDFSVSSFVPWTVPVTERRKLVMSSTLCFAAISGVFGMLQAHHSGESWVWSLFVGSVLFGATAYLVQDKVRPEASEVQGHPDRIGRRSRFGDFDSIASHLPEFFIGILGASVVFGLTTALVGLANAGVSGATTGLLGGAIAGATFWFAVEVSNVVQNSRGWTDAVDSAKWERIRIPVVCVLILAGGALSSGSLAVTVGRLYWFPGFLQFPWIWAGAMAGQTWFGSAGSYRSARRRTERSLVESECIPRDFDAFCRELADRGMFSADRHRFRFRHIELRRVLAGEWLDRRVPFVLEDRRSVERFAEQ